MSSSNCCFLTCIQVSQEAGQVVWYPHLFQIFPQFIVIHTVEGFGIVNKAEIDVFLELSCFFHDPEDVGNLMSGSSAFSKSSLNIWRFTVHVLLRPGLEYFEQAPFRGCLILIRDKMLCHFLVAKFQGFIFFQFGVNKRHLSAAYVPHTYVPHKYVFTILYSLSL